MRHLTAWVENTGRRRLRFPFLLATLQRTGNLSTTTTVHLPLPEVSTALMAIEAWALIWTNQQNQTWLDLTPLSLCGHRADLNGPFPLLCSASAPADYSCRFSGSIAELLRRTGLSLPSKRYSFPSHVMFSSSVLHFLVFFLVIFLKSTQKKRKKHLP